MSEPIPILPEILSELRTLGLKPRPSVPTGEFSILMHVMGLARDEHVKEMVALLRQYGATYGIDERERYRLRCRSDRIDATYVREFHKSATYSHFRGTIDSLREFRWPSLKSLKSYPLRGEVNDCSFPLARRYNSKLTSDSGLHV